MADEDLKLVAKVEADLSGLSQSLNKAETVIKQAAPKLQAAAGVNFGGTLPSQFQRGPANISFGGPSMASADINKWTAAQWEGVETTKKLNKTMGDLMKSAVAGVGVIGAIGIAAQAGSLLSAHGVAGMGGIAGQVGALGQLRGFQALATSIPLVGGPAFELSELMNRTPQPSGGFGKGAVYGIAGRSKGTVRGEIAVQHALLQEKMKGFTAGSRGYGSMLGGRHAAMAQIEATAAGMLMDGASPDAVEQYRKSAAVNLVAETGMQERERMSGYRRMDTAITATQLGAVGLALPAQLAAISGTAREDIGQAMREGDQAKADRIKKMGSAQMLAAILGSSGVGQEVSGMAMSLGGIRGSGMGLGGDEIANLLKEISGKLDDPTPGAGRS